FLKISAEAEVAEHFKESQVGFIPNFIYVICTNTFLRRSEIPCAKITLDILSADIVWLELLHSGRGEENRGVILRHGGRRGHDLVPPLGEEIKKLFAYFR